MSQDADDQEKMTTLILKDVLDGIEHFYGKEGVELVADFLFVFLPIALVYVACGYAWMAVKALTNTRPQRGTPR